MTNPLPRLEPTTLAERAYLALRDRILDGELAPGHFLREQEISQALGVSRTPVREALGRLATEGFVERLRHRGFRVPERPFARLLELYPIVAALEVLAGRAAFPSLGELDIERLRAANNRLETAVAGADMEAALTANEEFHGIISDRSNNRRLDEMLGELRVQLRPLERWYYADPAHGARSCRDHATILGALRAGDHARALRVFEHNMDLTRVSLLKRASAQGPPGLDTQDDPE